MLQLFFAVAFSAVPLTLYIPPIRSLNQFVETVEDLLRQTMFYTLHAYPRIRLAFTRIFSRFLIFSRKIVNEQRKLPEVICVFKLQKFIFRGLARPL